MSLICDKFAQFDVISLEWMFVDVWFSLSLIDPKCMKVSSSSNLKSPVVDSEDMFLSLRWISSCTLFSLLFLLIPFLLLQFSMPIILVLELLSIIWYEGWWRPQNSKRLQRKRLWPPRFSVICLRLSGRSELYQLVALSRFATGAPPNTSHVLYHFIKLARRYSSQDFIWYFIACSCHFVQFHLCNLCKICELIRTKINCKIIVKMSVFYQNLI